MVTWAEALGNVLGKITKIAMKYNRDLTLALTSPILTAIGEAFGWKVSPTGSPIFLYFPPADPSKPGLLEGIIGDGFKYAGATLGDIAKSTAAGVAKVGADVKLAIGPSFESLMAGEITDLMSGLGPGSPPELIEKAIQELAEKYLERLKVIGAVEVKSLPSLEELTGRAALIVSSNLGLAVGGLMAATIVDQVHPIKNIGFRDIMSDVIFSFRLPAMIGPVLSGPIWPGVLRPWEYRWNEKYPTAVAPAPDLIRQYVREGHLPEFQVEFPSEFGAEMLFHGFSVETSKKYWGAHWELIARGELRTMFVRGIIKQDQLLTQLKYHDILPEWRDRWIQIQYDLPGRIDSRWAYEFGKIDRDELRDLALKRGLDPKYADSVTDATIRNLFRSEITKLQTDAVTDYAAGWKTEDQLRVDMAEIEVPDDQVDYLVMDAKAKAERKRREDLRDIYITLFKNDEIVREEFESRLLAIPMRKDAALLIVKEELTRKKLFEEAEAITVVEAA